LSIPQVPQQNVLLVQEKSEGTGEEESIITDVAKVLIRSMERTTKVGGANQEGRSGALTVSVGMCQPTQVADRGY